MDNLRLVEGWIRLALEDWRLIESIDYTRYKGATVYHAQQFVEKLCKAIIAALGFEPPKTHKPSWEIDSILTDIRLGNVKLSIDSEVIELLEKISALAKTLEDEGTRPRYGVRHRDGIIPPDDYYSIDHVKLLLNDAIYIADLTLMVLTKLNYCSKLTEICGELSAIREKRLG